MAKKQSRQCAGDAEEKATEKGAKLWQGMEKVAGMVAQGRAGVGHRGLPAVRAASRRLRRTNMLGNRSSATQRLTQLERVLG